MTVITRQICIFLLFLGIDATAQRVFTPEEVRQDMSFLKNRFETMHPGMNYYSEAAAYDSVYQKLYDNVPASMTYQETFRYISPLITMVQDGHTSYKFKKKQYGKKPKLLPLYIHETAGQYYIAYNASPDTTLVRGTEIFEINDEPMPQIIKNLQSIYGTDNGNPSSKSYYATRIFNTFYFKYYGPSDSLKVSYQLPDSAAVQTQYIKCLNRSKISQTIVKRYKNSLRKNFDYKVVDSTNHIAKLDITSFSMKGKFLDIGQWKFKRLLKKRFARVERDNIEHLIVDFRGNGGGFIPNITRTMQYFAKEPFVLIDTVFFKKKAFNKVAPAYTIFSPLVTRMLFKSYDDTFFYRKPKKPKLYKPIKENHFNGEVYFLMDGGSYSATTFTMALAYDMGIGTFIGQPPGGANWGSFASTWNNFKLPNSKILIHMPLFKLQHSLPNQRSKSFVLTPDYEVDSSFEDFMERQDTVLDFTLDLIR
jgi:hypothetical protein